MTEDGVDPPRAPSAAQRQGAPTLVIPTSIRSADQLRRWQICTELAWKMLGPHTTPRTHPWLAQHLYSSDIPTD